MVRTHAALLTALALTAPAAAAPPSWRDCPLQGTRPVTTPPSKAKIVLRSPGYGFDYGRRCEYDDRYYYGTGRYLGQPAATLAPVFAAPLQGVGGGPGPARREPEAAVARLTIEFPADARVWVDDEPVPGRGRTLTLSSPELPLWTMHTFRVTARWEADGRSFEWERTADVLAGRASRVAVARGFTVTE
jgi:uncharacterized protein (TIGR03000 family)